MNSTNKYLQLRFNVKIYIFEYNKKSGLSDFIGDVLQKIMPSQQLLALFIIIVACLIGTEVN